MSKTRYGEKVGRTTRDYPIRMQLRSPYIPRFMGGGEGWRGPGWKNIRRRVLARDRNRSTTTGYDQYQGNGLQVDHIMPYRLGGRNKMSNLRVTDNSTNWATDLAHGFKERKPRRDNKW